MVTTLCQQHIIRTFRDLIAFGREILAATSRGICVSTNFPRPFSVRCSNTGSYGNSLSLQVDGGILLANTTKGLYYFRNGGRGDKKMGL